MNVTPLKCSIYIIVAIAVFVQSITVIHAVEHVINGHDDHCAMCEMAEQSAANTQRLESEAVQLVRQVEWRVKYSSFKLVTHIHNLSREPPVTG